MHVITSSSSVYFNSPDNHKLYSLEDISQHLTTPGTCKCGLRCPIKIEKQFSFDPDTISLPDHFQPSESLHVPCKLASQSHTVHAEPVVSLNENHSFRDPIPISGSLFITEASSTSVTQKKQTTGMKRTLSYALLPTVSSLSKKPKLRPTLKPISQYHHNIKSKEEKAAKLVQCLKKTATQNDSVVRVQETNSRNGNEKSTTTSKAANFLQNQKKLLSLLKRTTDITSVCFPSDTLSLAGTASVLKSGGGSTKPPSTSSSTTRTSSEANHVSVSEMEKLKKPVVQQSHLQEILEKAKHLSKVSYHQRLVTAQHKTESKESSPVTDQTGHTGEVVKGNKPEIFLSCVKFPAESKSFPVGPGVSSSLVDIRRMDQMNLKKPCRTSPANESSVSNEMKNVLSTENVVGTASLSPSFAEPASPLNVKEQAATPIVTALAPFVQNITDVVHPFKHASQKGDSKSKSPKVSVDTHFYDPPSVNNSISEFPGDVQQTVAPLDHTSPTCKETSPEEFSQNVLNNRQPPCVKQVSNVTNVLAESISSDELVSPALNQIDSFQTPIDKSHSQASPKDSLLQLSSPNANIQLQDSSRDIHSVNVNSRDLMVQISDKIETIVPEIIPISTHVPKEPLVHQGEYVLEVSQASPVQQNDSTSSTTSVSCHDTSDLPSGMNTDFDPGLLMLIQSPLAQNMVFSESHSETELTGNSPHPDQQLIEAPSSVLPKLPVHSPEHSFQSVIKLSSSQNNSDVANNVESDTATPNIHELPGFNFQSDNVLNAPCNNLDSDTATPSVSNISGSRSSLLSKTAATCPPNISESPNSVQSVTTSSTLDTSEVNIWESDTARPNAPNFPNSDLAHQASHLHPQLPNRLQSDTAGPIAPRISKSSNSVQSNATPNASNFSVLKNSLDSDATKSSANISESPNSLLSTTTAPIVIKNSLDSDSTLASAPNVSESPNSLLSKPAAPIVIKGSLDSDPTSASAPNVPGSPNSLLSKPAAPIVIKGSLDSDTTSASISESPNSLLSSTTAPIVIKGSLESDTTSPSISESPDSLLSKPTAPIVIKGSLDSDSKSASISESPNSLLSSTTAPIVIKSSLDPDSTLASAPNVPGSPNSLLSKPAAPIVIKSSLDSDTASPSAPNVPGSPNSLLSKPAAPIVIKSSLDSDTASPSAPNVPGSPNSLLSKPAAPIAQNISSDVEPNDNRLVADSMSAVSQDPNLPLNSSGVLNNNSNSSRPDYFAKANLDDVDLAVHNNRIFSDLALDSVVEEYKDEDQRSTPSAVITTSAQFRNGTPLSTCLSSPFPSTPDHCDNGSDTMLSASHSSDSSLSLRSSSVSEFLSRPGNNSTLKLSSSRSREQCQPNMGQPCIPAGSPPPVIAPVYPTIATRSSTRKRTATSSLSEIKSPGSDGSSIVDSVFEAEESSVPKKKKHKKVIR